MKLMNEHVKGVLAGGLLLYGCAVAADKGIVQLPKYDADRVNSKWELVTNIDQAQSFLIMGLMASDKDLTDAQKKCLVEKFDRVVFWKAATVTNLYQGHFKEAEITSTKGTDAVQSAYDCTGETA